MIIFPAIDLKEGKCVRLYQGDMNSAQIVSLDVLDTALKFKDEGAEFIHMVDLDGAIKGNMKNLEKVKNVIDKVKLPVQFGGGIRDIETIESLIAYGVKRVILGTAALNNPNIVKEAVKKYKDKIAVGIDAREELVAIDGWVNVSKVNYIDFAKIMENIGVETIIFTDIKRDGTLKGANIDQLKKLKNSVKCNIIASGGVKDIKDLKELKNIEVYGSIIGKAIYSGNINLKEAIAFGRE